MLKQWVCVGWLLGHISFAVLAINRPLISSQLALATLILLFIIFLSAYWLIWHAQAKFEKRLVFAGVVACLSFMLGQWHFNQVVNKFEVKRVKEVHEVEAWIWVDRLDEQRAQLKRQSILLYQVKNRPIPNDPNQHHLKAEFAQRVVTYLPHTDALQIGQWYYIKGRLEPIRGYAVPHVFSTERWAMQQGWVGRLSIHHKEMLSDSALEKLPFDTTASLWTSFKLHIERQRLALRQYLGLQQAHWPYVGLMLALITGDESLLSKDIQQQFQRLGISHLLAISGPHVLLIALMLTYVWQQLVARFAPQVYLYITKPKLSAFIFLLGVSVYTLFCGAEIPALRTWTFSCIAALYVFSGQVLSRLEITLVAASLMLYFQPLWVETAGFWLSFGASFILLHIYLTLKQGMQPTHSSRVELLKHTLKVLFESQWKMFIALFPLVILFFKHVSWLAPITNLFAIPVLGSVIVPLNLFATCVWFILPTCAELIFALSHAILNIFISVLNQLDYFSSFAYQYVALTPLSLVCMGLALIIIFLPKGIVPSYWAIFCIFPVIFQAQQQPKFALDIVDVGQGQAIFLQSKGESMLIDTGGTWQGSQMDLTEWIWLPYFSRRGIRQLDYVLLTHLDSDHSGAYERLAQNMEVRQLISNEKVAFTSEAKLCEKGQIYQVGDVKLKVLSPQQTNTTLPAQQRNEHSCVLLMELNARNKIYRILLMGDAGWETEFTLLHSDLTPVDVLVLGHHGSKHSSAYDFLSHLQPKIAIASAGYQNRYGHPHQIVQQRLNALGISLWTTIEHGTIQLRFDELGNLKLNATRKFEERTLY